MKFFRSTLHIRRSLEVPHVYEGLQKYFMYLLRSLKVLYVYGGLHKYSVYKRVSKRTLVYMYMDVIVSKPTPYTCVSKSTLCNVLKK